MNASINSPNVLKYSMDGCRHPKFADKCDPWQRCEELEGELGVLYDVSKGLDGVSDRYSNF